MFRGLAELLCSSSEELDTFLHWDYAVYDWTHLGIFTGSCVAEYAQTHFKKGVHYKMIPAPGQANP
jgi:hypothetical protein